MTRRGSILAALAGLSPGVLLGVVLGTLLGCGESPPAGDGPGVGAASADGGAGSPAAPFRDVTAGSGVAFTHFNAASERRYLPETMGSGVAIFDSDGDDRPDLYFLDGAPLEGAGAAAGGDGGTGGVLYRNLGGGRFEEVAGAAGLKVPFYAMGAAVGDVDNDGRTDLFVTGVGGDRLFLNLGDGRFEDASAALDLEPGFGSSAAFLDYDRDGWLDLLVGRYVTWSLAGDVRCSPDGVHPTYCTPEVYPGASNRLLRNVEGRRFEDVTRAAGVERPDGKTLGVAVLDHDLDGWPDIAVANDTARNFLFVNRRDGTFAEEAVAAGFAFSPSGATRGGMGIAAGDLTGSGRADLVIGNFSQEMAAYYRATPSGVYSDRAAQVELGIPTLMTLAFGTLVFDHDGDGALDVMFANGHIEPEIAAVQGPQTYAQRPQLFRNLGGGETFREVRGSEGGPLESVWVGRGLAAGDLDGDGDLDLVLTQNGRAARVLENVAPRSADSENAASERSWLRIRPAGNPSNRTGLGLRATAVAGERRFTRWLTSGGSYLSASEPVLTFGLGDLDRLDRLELQWPSGTVQTIADPPLNRLLVIEEAAAKP